MSGLSNHEDTKTRRKASCKHFARGSHSLPAATLRPWRCQPTRAVSTSTPLNPFESLSLRGSVLLSRRARLSFQHFQVGNRRDQPLQPDVFKGHIHFLVVAAHLAVDDNALAKELVPHPLARLVARWGRGRGAIGAGAGTAAAHDRAGLLA